MYHKKVSPAMRTMHYSIGEQYDDDVVYSRSSERDYLAIEKRLFLEAIESILHPRSKNYERSS